MQDLRFKIQGIEPRFTGFRRVQNTRFKTGMVAYNEVNNNLCIENWKI
jgi:hypothetical protein